jgi:hypothetical protein
MEPGEASIGRRPERIDPKDVDLHKTDSSELSASTAGTPLPTVVLSDEEKAKRLEEKKRRKKEEKRSKAKEERSASKA